MYIKNVKKKENLKSAAESALGIKSMVTRGLGPLDSLVWFVPSLRYTRGIG
jgi:hypothetical protein